MAKSKKIKIVKEEVNTPYKEVGKEDEGEVDKDLEDEVEERENFSDFVEQSQTAPSSNPENASPILQPTQTNPPEPQEDLEEELEDVDETADAGEVYNAPEYSGDYSEMPEETASEIPQLTETNEARMGRSLNLREMEAEQQASQQRLDNQEEEREIKEYRSKIRPEEERRMPFEREERKKRRLNI